MTASPRNARADAAAVLGDRFEVRVLEPSPPAVDDGDFYADDPAVIGQVPSGSKVVTPTKASDLTWASLAAEDPDVAAFAAEHWLAGGELADIPDGFGEARTDLNRLAFYVLSPARIAANGKMALRYTHGGFGTPFFGDDRQIRVEGDRLVVQSGDTVVDRPIGSLADAATLVGIELDTARGDEFDVPNAGDVDRRLDVGADHVEFLGAWFGFVTAVFEEFRLDGRDGDDVGRVQLWPEHFDPAVEIGNAEDGARASYGGSPGDAAHPEPYLYVAAWGEIDRSDSYWNDDAFNGASLGYAELRAADDPRSTALTFLRDGLGRLRGD